MPDDTERYEREKTVLRGQLYKVFPGIYLTIMSVIQGVCIGILLSNGFKFFGEAETCTDQALVILHAVMSFCGLVIVTFEYSYYIAIVKRPPFFSDIITPMLLGTSQIAPVFVLNDPAKWWCANVLFGVVGVFAYLNSILKIKAEKKMRNIEARHRLVDSDTFHLVSVKHLKLSFGGGAICGLMAYFHWDRPAYLPEIPFLSDLPVLTVEICAAIAILIGFYLTIAASRVYLRSVYVNVGIYDD